MVKGSVGDSAGNSFIIASNTRGMVFLGTPFHGSPVAPWAKIISTMLSAIHETDTRKIKDLDQKSDKLKILAESFAMTLNQRIRDNKEIRVSFFHETKSLHGSLVGLPDDYACLLPFSLVRLFPNQTLEYRALGIMPPSTRTTPPCVSSPTKRLKGIKACLPLYRRCPSF